MIYGIQPIIEAIKSKKKLNKILIKNGLKGNNYKKLLELIKKYSIPFKYVSLNALNNLSKKNHQGVCAYISPIIFYKIEDILPKIYKNNKNPLILILDHITDVRNFGSIIRTSECIGIDTIIIPLKGSAPINSDTIKTSSGAVFNIPICKEKNILNSLIFLKKFNIQIIAAIEKSNSSFYKHNLSGPLAIILGNEEKGISFNYLNIIDKKLKLPVFGKINSLNVSVVCGIIFYEIKRQRNLV